MPLTGGDDRPETFLIERRALRLLLLLYSLLILYGTFIPFHFNADPEFVQFQWNRLFTPPFAGGVRQFSIPDVISNVLLFIPFGLLWVGSEIGKPIFCGLFGASFGLICLGLLFGLGIEVGQTWFPGRIPSLLDAVCDGLGAGIGGSFGYFLFRALRGSFGAILTIIIRQRPSLIVLAVFILVLLADAYYPFEVTIDISTVWNSFKHIHWLPFVDGSHRFRIELLVEKGFLLAAVGYLVTINLRPDGVPEARALAWCLCTALAAIVEGGKLFFAGRVPNGENVILCAGGALFGTFVIVPLSERELVRTHSRAILIVLLLGLEVYSELLPFDWVSSIDELWSRVSTIEWLPFAAYYGAAPQSALFDLGKKLIIVGPLGFVVASRKPGRSLAALFGLISGAMLEASQVALRSRTASITDVLIFGIAAWSGAVAFEHFARIRSSERPGKFNEIPGKVWLPITGEENRTDKLSPARRRQD